MNEIIRLATPEIMAIRGGWMAVSAPGSVIQIGGAPAETKDDAIQHFDEELAAWEELSGRAQNIK